MLSMWYSIDIVSYNDEIALQIKVKAIMSRLGVDALEYNFGASRS